MHKKTDTDIRCPLCKSNGQFFYKDKNRLFYRCNNCLGIFPDKVFIPDKEIETLRYHKHNNNADDPGYQKFVQPIVSAIIKDFSIQHTGLDFGSGSGSAILKLLKSGNFQIEQYDPVFHNYPELLKRKYNYIACCEVIEHFHSPYKEFSLLKKLILPAGKLYCMTTVYSEETNFDKWYYKNDLTHVFFYHNKTFEWIKERFEFSSLIMNNNLIVLSLL